MYMLCYVHVCVCECYQDVVSGRYHFLNEIEVANEFVGDSEHRLRLFGKFK